MTLAMDRNFFSGLVVRLRLFPLNTSSLREVGVAVNDTQVAAVQAGCGRARRQLREVVMPSRLAREVQVALAPLEQSVTIPYF